GREPLHIPFKGSGQRLIEIVNIEDGQSVGRRIGSEIVEMSVTARLHTNVGCRRVGQIGRHYRRRAAQEGKGIAPHAAIADRQQFLDPALALFNQDLDWVPSVRWRNPPAVRAAWYLSAECGSSLASFVSTPAYTGQGFNWGQADAHVVTELSHKV